MLSFISPQLWNSFLGIQPTLTHSSSAIGMKRNLYWVSLKMICMQNSVCIYRYRCTYKYRIYIASLYGKWWHTSAWNAILYLQKNQHGCNCGWCQPIHSFGQSHQSICWQFRCTRVQLREIYPEVRGEGFSDSQTAGISLSAPILNDEVSGSQLLCLDQG